jgi:hypothetical protein
MSPKFLEECMSLRKIFARWCIRRGGGRQRHLYGAGFPQSTNFFGPFEFENHPMHRWGGHAEESLHVGFGWRSAEHQCVGVDKREIQPLLRCEARSRISCPGFTCTLGEQR